VTDERLSLFAKFFTEKRGAVGDGIALDHNEAVIDLIEPRRVGQGVMEIGFGISRRELPNSPGHLNRDFVSNQNGSLCRAADRQQPRRGRRHTPGGCDEPPFSLPFAFANVRCGVKQKVL
jgi:hypothetical protein